MAAKIDSRGNCHAHCGFDPDHNPYCRIVRQSFGSCSGPCEGPCYIIASMLLTWNRISTPKLLEREHIGRGLVEPPLK